MNKIKIAQVIYGLKYGGAEKLLIPLSTRLDPRRFSCTVIALTSAGPVEKELLDAGADVQIIRRDGRFSPYSFWLLVRMLRREKFDIIHTHLQNADIAGGCAAKLLGIKHLITIHRGAYLDQGITDFLKQKLRVALADKIIAVSRATADYCVHKLKANRGKIEVIYNGINSDIYQDSPGDVSKKGNLDSGAGQIILGAFGRVEIEKGHRYLIEALPRVRATYPQASVVITGEGNLREELQRLSESLGLSGAVKFLGGRVDVAQIIRGLDIVVQPSLYEGLPLTCMEAMAAGKPVIATDVEGTPELIEDRKNGLLVKPRDSAALAKAILDLLGDKGLAQSLSAEGKKTVRNFFSEERMLTEIARLYVSLIR